jgi:hypothetical protein
MSLDKNELKYLVNELKKVFATKKEFDIIKDVVDEPPVYVEPTASVSIKPVNMFKNELTEVTITPKFVQNDAGSVRNVVVKRNGEVIYDVGVLDTFTDVVSADHNETITYTVEIYYNKGGIKNSSIGIPYPEYAIEAGKVKATTSITAYAPSFYGVMDENYNFTNSVKILNPNKRYTFEHINMTSARFAYAYPSSYGEITSIKDANNFEYIQSYTKTVMENDGVEYLVYILTDPVTITDFKQIFS